MFRALLRGAVAGAAGTTALNAATYVDMVVRARPASDTPQQAVEKLGELAGQPVPGEGPAREYRLSGLGPLLGIATGVAIGAGAGLLRPVITRLPASLGALLLGGAAMAASDVPLARLDVSDPSKWSAADWATDAILHLAYGAVTFAALSATRDHTRRGHAPAA